MKKKLRRKTLKIATAPQIRLFEAPEDDAVVGQEVTRPGVLSFSDPDPRDIFLGGRRLDEYLRDAGERRPLVLRDVVRAQDYSAFEASYLHDGRPAYSPASMVALILYGLMNGVNSLRGLERMARMDLGCMWVCGGITPDHSSLGRFIVRHGEQMRDSFFVQMTADTLKRMGRGVEETALDGTVVQAVASAHNTLKLEAARAKLQEAREAQLQRPDDPKASEKVYQAERVVQVAEERAAARKQKGRDAEQTRVSPTEPESMIQPLKGGGSKPSYKPIILATPDRVIVGQTVEPSSETKPVAGLIDQANRIGQRAVPQTEAVVDGDLAVAPEAAAVAPPQTEEAPTQGESEAAGTQPPAEPASQRAPGAHVRDVLADAGFFTDDVIQSMDERSIEFLCPQGSSQSSKSWDKTSKKAFAKAQFIFDLKLDGYRCPAGALLTPSRRSEGTSKTTRYVLYTTPDCAGCALRAQCTKSPQGRSIKRYPGDERKDKLRDRMKKPEVRSRYRKRAAWVEPVFSSLKLIQGLVRFARHGLARVRLEFALHAMAHNLGRLLAFIQAPKSHQKPPKAPQALSPPLIAFLSGLLAVLSAHRRVTNFLAPGPSMRPHHAPCP